MAIIAVAIILADLCLLICFFVFSNYVYEIGIKPNFKLEFCNLPLLLSYIIVMKINDFQSVSLTIKATELVFFTLWLFETEGFC